MVHAASRVGPMFTGASTGFAGTFTAAGKVINGRSKTRKNSQANATVSGVIITSEMERMCHLVKPNQYQCISTKE